MARTRGTSAGDIEGATSGSGRARPPSGRRAAPGGGEFVGRERELAQIDPALENALGGQGGVVLLAGDPGIGKTRTAEEIAARAHERGAAVYWGRCHEGAGVPAYWPWVQILRGLVRDLPPRTLGALLRAGATELAQIVPEVRQRLGGDLPPTRSREPEQARFELFDRISGFLASVAARKPLVVVLDDLHWADTPSLLLLQFLAREATGAPLLLVGTYRELEVDSDHALAPVLNELGRVRSHVRLLLRGLPADAVHSLAVGVCGTRVSHSFSEALLRRTEGNPFFVEELLRHCVEEGVEVGANGLRLEEATTPQGVQAVIRRRLARLPPPCNRVLAVAAVIGRSFDASILREILRGDGAPLPVDLDRELQPALEARVVTEVRGGGERYRFSHALVREVLYEEQPRLARGSLHHRIAAAFERRFGGAPGAAPLERDDLPQLAYHFFESSRGGEGGQKAVDYSVLAARQAARALAYEDAAAHYGRALEALARIGSPPPEAAESRANLLLALAEEQVHAGEPQRAKETFLQAAAAARACGSPEFLARAALGFEVIGADLGGSEADKTYVNLLEEAAAALGGRKDPYRARVLARLSQVPHRSMPRARRVSMSEEAEGIARQSGDPYTLAYVLLGRNYALWDSDPPQARYERAGEIVRQAESAGERALALDGRLQRAFTLIEMGRRAELDAEIHGFRSLAEDLHQPRYVWLSLILQTSRAAFSGEFAEAERLANQGLAIGQHHNQSNAMQVFALQLFAVRREVGGIEEAELSLRALAEQHPIAAWHCALAFLYSEIGRAPEAQQEFAPLAVRGFVDVPIDPLWLISIGCLAEVCAFLGDAKSAEVLYPMLLPHAAGAIGAGGAVSLGSASHQLGLLARTMGRMDEAVGHFEEALRFDLGLRAHPAAARCQFELARTLLQRDRRGDRQLADDLMTKALQTAERLGMSRLAESLRRAATPPAPVPHPAPASAIADGGAMDDAFRREGDFWTLACAGRVVRLRDAKGLRYLALLLESPGREFHVADMVAATRLPPLAETGAMLDAPAKSAYRTRLGELRAELEEAQRFNDTGRAETLRNEIGVISRQLSAAVGSGGRDRPSSSYAERARLAVTQCVKASLKKIRAAHPALGHHLSTCVRTGYYCAYDPGPDPPPWRPPPRPPRR